jgi:transposase InsO family protein
VLATARSSTDTRGKRVGELRRHPPEESSPKEGASQADDRTSQRHGTSVEDNSEEDPEESPRQSFKELGVKIEVGTEQSLPRERPRSESTPCCIDLRPDAEEIAYADETEIERDELAPDEAPDAFTTNVQLRQGDVPAKVDSGAYSIWVDAAVYNRNSNYPVDEGGEAVAADGSTLAVLGNGRMTMGLWGRTFDIPVRVMHHLPSQVLIGRRFLIKHHVKLDFGTMQGHFQKNVRGTTVRYKGKLSAETVEAVEETAKIADADVRAAIEGLDLSDMGEDANDFRAMLFRHEAVFKGLGLATGEQFRINVPPDFDVMKLDCPPRRRSEKERETEEREVRAMLDLGVLRPSNAPASTNNVFVQKKTVDVNGMAETRTATDHRKINVYTENDSYPIPAIEDIVNWLATKKIFTTLDLRSGYWSVALAEESRRFTAVKTVLGVMEYMRMGMGLKGASAHFQRLMERVLVDQLWKTALAYQDDVNAGSETTNSHVQDVDEILTSLFKKGLRLKLSKCRFGQSSVETLGFRVSHDSIIPSDKHIKTLAEWPEPTSGQELLRFIGVVRFFGRYVSNCSEHAAPLYELLSGTGWNKKKQKSVPVRIPEFSERWGDRQRRAFRHLRDAIADPEIMTPPHTDRKKRVVTDASNIGYGAVLLQLQPGPDESWRPIAYIARKLQGGEPRYTTTEKEAGAFVWALKKWRHLLDGAKFEAVTDHMALKWLLNLQLPHYRLANWVMEVMTLDFDVIHAAGAGELMAISDALSRDFVPGSVLCDRCLEVVAEVESDVPLETECAAMMKAQEETFGNLEKYVQPRDDYMVNEQGLVCRLLQNRVRVVVPEAMKERVLNRVHGSRHFGHWGVTRTALAVAKRYWWKGWTTDVEQHIKKCLPCSMIGLGRRTRRQARMEQYTPRRRFELVAMDITTFSPTGVGGENKILVIGDVFTRFLLAIPLQDEKSQTVADALWTRWFAVFGPPERLLTDLGKPLVSDIMKSLCKRAGVEKIFTSAYHPETNGMIERFNRTLGVDLAKTVLTMETWPEYVAICVFRYNCSTHEATGQTPYKGMFGVESFEFDSGIDLRFRQDDEPANLPMRLAEVHKRLYDRSLAARTVAAKVYDKAVDETQYEVGDEVFVFHPPGLLEVGRKLQAPWRGPYRVDAKLSQVSYLLKDREGKVSRTHVNRLTSKKPDVRETQDPVQGLFPDSRRLLENVLTYDPQARKFKIKSRGRSGSTWVPETKLPDVVVRAYQLDREAHDR